MGNIFRVTILFFIIILLFSCFTGCNGLIYHPDKYLHAHPDQFNVDYNILTIASTDKIKLSAWKLKSKKPAKTLVLFFHGNAQNITSHFVNLSWLTEYETDVIIFDYRGYGLSEGKPNPKGVSEDGKTMLDYAYSDYKNLSYKKFVVYTQSLGGAVALRSLEDFAHTDEISLLVLDSTFLSPRQVAQDKTNVILSWLVSNSFTANSTLSHIKMPVLSIHSKLDPVINYDLGVKLFEAIPSSQKEFWTLDVPGHGDVYFIEQQKYRKELLRVLGN